MIPTNAQVTEALGNTATYEHGMWSFGGDTWHTHKSACAVVRACLILGQPVSDVLTGELFVAVADRLAELEQRMAAIETATCRHC